ncbi:putative EamA domain-containing protein [Rosa chinensis]|uniref:WAT1-related protein n=1 Tax=Rosa chinensis TaxID=74649 RepID=A0A2P6PDV8_ROSCH|nr:WAT1-related protein At1g25270 [Rosa chinensis]PRQ20111.1 putative EamA domain-containing protein [Rosa chinensis]
MQNCKAMEGMKPVMVMVLVQSLFAGMNVLYKLVANDGINFRILIAYRMVFAAAFMTPLALVFEIRKSWRNLTWTVLFQSFLTGLFGGTVAQNLYIESLAKTSATYSVAIFNLVPAITFILSTSLRMEKLAIRTHAGKAKVVGTILGIGGAMLFTFYKGFQINIWSTNINLLRHYGDKNNHGQAPSSANKDSGSILLGSGMALGSCTSFAIWLIIQAKMNKGYPYLYSSTALMAFMGSVQSVAFSICMDRDWKQWKLGWNIQLLAMSYSGIFNSGIAVTLMAWCVKKGGPVFVASFQPLLLVMVAVAGSLLLDEKLHLGSVLGGLLVVSGLYMVLWGKSKEMKNQITPLPATASLQCQDEHQSPTIEVITSSSMEDMNHINDRNVTNN